LKVYTKFSKHVIITIIIIILSIAYGTVPPHNMSKNMWGNGIWGLKRSSSSMSVKEDAIAYKTISRLRVPHLFLRKSASTGDMHSNDDNALLRKNIPMRLERLKSFTNSFRNKKQSLSKPPDNHVENRIIFNEFDIPVNPPLTNILPTSAETSSSLSSSFQKEIPIETNASLSDFNETHVEPGTRIDRSEWANSLGDRSLDNRMGILTSKGVVHRQSPLGEIRLDDINFVEEETILIEQVKDDSINPSTPLNEEIPVIPPKELLTTNIKEVIQDLKDNSLNTDLVNADDSINLTHLNQSGDSKFMIDAIEDESHPSNGEMDDYDETQEEAEIAAAVRAAVIGVSDQESQKACSSGYSTPIAMISPDLDITERKTSYFSTTTGAPHNPSPLEMRTTLRSPLTLSSPSMSLPRNDNNALRRTKSKLAADSKLHILARRQPRIETELELVQKHTSELNAQDNRNLGVKVSSVTVNGEELAKNEGDYPPDPLASQIQKFAVLPKLDINSSILRRARLHTVDGRADNNLPSYIDTFGSSKDWDHRRSQSTSAILYDNVSRPYTPSSSSSANMNKLNNTQIWDKPQLTNNNDIRPSPQSPITPSTTASVVTSPISPSTSTSNMVNPFPSPSSIISGSSSSMQCSHCGAHPISIPAPTRSNDLYKSKSSPNLTKSAMYSFSSSSLISRQPYHTQHEHYQFRDPLPNSLSPSLLQQEPWIRELMDKFESMSQEVADLRRLILLKQDNNKI